LWEGVVNDSGQFVAWDTLPRNAVMQNGAIPASATICVNCGDNSGYNNGNRMTVTDSSGNGMAEEGELLTYTIYVTNTSSAPMAPLMVLDTLPLHTSYVSSMDGGTYVAGSNTIVFSQANIAAGDTVSFTFTVRVANDLNAVNVIYNQATVVSNNTDTALVSATIAVYGINLPGEGASSWDSAFFDGQGNFIFNIGKLGWTNCDQTWNWGSSMTSISTTLTGYYGQLVAGGLSVQGNTVAFFCAEGENVMIALNYESTVSGNTITTPNMPIGVKGKIIAISIDGGKFAYGEADNITITQNMQVTVNLQPSTQADIQQQLETLNGY
jgi:uncharacterized repeat protein (TIGR01451 family)